MLELIFELVHDMIPNEFFMLCCYENHFSVFYQLNQCSVKQTPIKKVLNKNKFGEHFFCSSSLPVDKMLDIFQCLLYDAALNHQSKTKRILLRN